MPPPTTWNPFYFRFCKTDYDSFDFGWVFKSCFNNESLMTQPFLYRRYHNFNFIKIWLKKTIFLSVNLFQSFFSLNNLEVVPGMALNVSSSLTKELKLTVRKFCRPIRGNVLARLTLNRIKKVLHIKVCCLILEFWFWFLLPL